MLRFYELAPSPNNVKVRLALAYKGIPFEVEPVSPTERSNVLEVSGQVNTPVIADRGVVINDSEAILQYLDANYPDHSRLFPADREGRRACEAWNKTLGEKLVPHWLPVFLTAIGRREAFDPSARTGFLDAMGWLEAELAAKDSFGTPSTSINDLRVAQWTTYALPGPGLIARSPLFARFRDLFSADPTDFPRLTRFLTPWNDHLS